MSKSWQELRPDFERVVFARGMSNVAHLIPADRATVYRLLRGDTQRPTRAVLAGIERVVISSQVQQSQPPRP